MSPHSIETVAFDLSAFGKLQIAGKDRASFLQNFTTNDVAKPGTGDGCESFITTAQARIVAWIRLAARENELYLNMEPVLVPKVLSHLGKYVIGEEVEFIDRTEADFLLLLTGSELLKTLETVADWRLWQNGLVTWSGDSLMMQRCDFLGLPGVFVWGDASKKKSAVLMLSKWKISLLTTDHPLWNRLRVEARTPAYGIDLDETMLPQEANRTDQAISFTKGCYIGQETVARIRAYGHVNRLLVRLRMDGADEVESWTGAKLMTGAKEVGRLSTVAFIPQDSCLKALGLLRKEHLASGTELRAINAGQGERNIVVE